MIRELDSLDVKRNDAHNIIKLSHIGSGGEKGWIYSVDGVVGTLPATQYKDPFKTVVYKEGYSQMKGEEAYRIRKLTPLECWRLMAFSDEDFKAAERTGNSNTQLYKQAGNSIVVNVLYYIFKELYDAMPYLFDDLKVGSFFSGIGAFESALDRLFDDINQNESMKKQ